ncbi:centrosomal protein of 112 kDa-like isoform X1 [Mytilus trossulus]|uniref:centrosomal protein of 112 kDa-like isoform X1 n=1 Tax=Mytilus trossulus TaxID=6551 RepID=UPI003006B5CC
MAFSEDPVYVSLDQKFDKVLADMKPYVLKLPHKTDQSTRDDRQKCAIWIKKLCEPVTGITGRKNRNAYAQLMLHMLKRGVLEGPFTSKPQDGELPTLPPYMSIYFDEPSSSPDTDDKVPDWVNGELTSSVGSSLFRSNIGNPAASSTWKSLPSPISPQKSRRRAYTSIGIDLDRDPGYTSPSRGLEKPQPGPYDDSFLGRGHQQDRVHFMSDDEGSYIKKDEQKKKKDKIRKKGSDEELAQPSPPGYETGGVTNLFGTTGGTTFFDDHTKDYGKENIQMKTKMLEARFHEEKLKLQQRHDVAVQKILDRKNTEIEELKANYRAKAKELEDTITKLERKIQSVVRDSQNVRETKDKQIAELRKMVEDTTEKRKSDFERKLTDLQTEFEQEKFDMQKQHTKNIQEILDDTNARLQKMEQEYSHQTHSTTSIIKELESRLHQLLSDSEQTAKSKANLEREKIDVESKLDRLSSDYSELRESHKNLDREHQRMIEAHNQEIRTVKNKTDASLEFMKQEHNLSSAKATDTISDLEQSVDQLKRSLKDAEEQRQRQIREMEQVQQQGKIHLENLHDKQVRTMKLEMEHSEQSHQKQVHKLEQSIREKEDEIKSLQEQNKQQTAQSEKSLTDFKGQVEKNQTRMYDEMKQQMERVEADLNKSKQVREKQAREFQKQLDEERDQHERREVELKMSLEQEKAQYMKEFHQQKEMVLTEHDREIDTMKEQNRNEVYDIECRFKEKQDKDSKKVHMMEKQIQELREEVVQANQLRKQQLVELGLLREEEKQKMQRDHEAEVSKLRSEMEQQRLELQKSHSTELEKMLEKTNNRLKDIEREYNERGNRAAETINELQNTISHLRDEIKRIKDSGDKKLKDTTTKQEEDRRNMKKNYTTNLDSMRKDNESQHNRNRTLERRIEQMEADHDEKITQLKLAFEEKMRGLMPSSVRQELEDTIDSLKSQVNSLQQKTLVLQEDLDLRNQYPQFSASSPIKAL